MSDRRLNTARRGLVRTFTNHPVLRFPRKETERIVRDVYKGEAREIRPVCVVFTTNARIRAINRKFLGHDRPTDVIAFPLSADGEMADEVYISLDAARTQARAYRVRFRDEARRLIIHGCLHLAGYRDDTRRRKERMHARENVYLARWKES